MILMNSTLVDIPKRIPMPCRLWFFKRSIVSDRASIVSQVAVRYSRFKSSVYDARSYCQNMIFKSIIEVVSGVTVFWFKRLQCARKYIFHAISCKDLLLLLTEGGLVCNRLKN